MNCAAPVVNNLAFLNGNQDLTAVNLTTRAVAWTLAGTFKGTPAISNGQVYVISGSQVKVLNATTGTTVSALETSDTGLTGQPLVAVDALAVSSGTATYLFNLQTGALVQTIPHGGPVSAAGGNLYLAGTDGMLRVYRPNAPTFDFASSGSIGVSAYGYTATGQTFNATLGFAPAPGVVLTAVNNTGSNPISGTFSNLTNGATINLVYNGTTYGFTASYSGGDGNDLTLTFTSAQPQAPQITSAPPPGAVSTLAYSFTYTASGYPAPTFSVTAGNLPPGLTLAPSGVLSETPTTPGTYTGTVTATNGVSPDAAQNFSITVSTSNAPVFTSAAPGATLLLGVAYNLTCTATGNPAPAFSVSSGSLPPGLVLNSAGMLSGTATATGTYTGTITAGNGVLPNATQGFTFIIQQAPQITGGPSAILPINVPVAAGAVFLATGYPAPTFSVTAGTLGPGLSLSSSGVLSGTPTQTGTYSSTITASNGVSPSASIGFFVYVEQAPTFTSTTPPGGRMGTAYTFSCTASGYPAATFSVSSGSLPPGLTLSASGLLSGTPTQAGTFTGTLQALNAVSFANQAFSITIQSAPVPPTITNGPPPATGIINLPYGFTYKGTGNPTWALGSGSLPPGLTLSSSGVISGTPTQLGIFTGSVTATNGFAPAATQAFSILISANPISSYTILHNFKDGSVANDAYNPEELPLYASDGNLYLPVQWGGAYSEGALVKVTPQGITTLFHSFGAPAPDGNDPCSALIQGPDGNFYGTTYYGGSTGNGCVFKITPQGVLTILHNFKDGSVTNDGVNPSTPLCQGSDGNFYGETIAGGASLSGAIFKMTPQGVVTTFHSFYDGSVAHDGMYPEGNLVQGSDGNFYGTTREGGSAGFGTVFKVTPQGAVTLLHNFGDGTVANDGKTITCPLLLAADGNFYGTTEVGGSAADGTVFKMTPQGAVTILHSFSDGSVFDDGVEGLTSGLIQGPDGNFYSVTASGGSANGGTIFRMTPQGVVTILHHFGDGSTTHDGLHPNAGMVQGANGMVYGTALNGGSAGQGAFFAMKLGNAPSILSANTASFTAGHAGSFTVVAAGSPAPTFSASGLPSWASLNAATGVISGTPPDVSGAPFTVTLTASNGISPSATQTLILNVLLAAPVIASEPPFTSGTANTVSWNSVAGANQYEVQASTDPNFGTWITSGWISATAYTFNSFTVGSTYFYRVHAQAAHGADGTWSQSSPGDFSSDTLANVTNGSGGVTLAMGSPTLVTGRIANPSFEQTSGTLAGWTATSTGNLFGELVTGSFAPMPTDGSQFCLMYSSYFSAVAAGDNFSLGQTVDLTDLSSIQFDASLGLTNPWNNQIKVDFLIDGTSVWTQTAAGSYFNQSIPLGGFTGMHTIAIRSTALGAFNSTYTYIGIDNFRTYTVAFSNAPGSVISAAIAPGFFSGWGTLSFGGNVAGSGTALTVDVLNGGGTVLAANISSGTDLSTVPAVAGVSSIKLRANLSTSNTANTPTLNNWSVNYFGSESSPWSDPVSSTQSALAALGNWESLYFTAQQMADPTVSGPSAIPQKDGVPNLLKYLFDIDPSVPMTAADHTALPVLGLDTTTTPGTTYLTLTYRENTEASGMTINVQTSSDLQAWPNVGPDLTRNVGIDPVTGDPLMEVEVKVTSPTRQFIRLNVVTP